MHRRVYRAIHDRDPEAARKAIGDHLVLAQASQESEEVEEGELIMSRAGFEPAKVRRA